MSLGSSCSPSATTANFNWQIPTACRSTWRLVVNIFALANRALGKSQSAICAGLYAGRPMNRPAIRFALVALFVALCCPAEAQQVKKAPRIGFLAITSPRDMSSRMAAFRQGLRELGYIEGKTIVLDDRYAEGKLDRLRSMTAELVQLKADVIVTSGPLGTRTAKEATATLPIVMAYDNDPVGSGFVASLAARRQHYRIINSLPRNNRKATGTSQGNRP